MENRTDIATATTTLPQKEERQHRDPSIFFPFDIVVDLLIDIMDGFNGYYDGSFDGMMTRPLNPNTKRWNCLVIPKSHLHILE
jgi:hypothetical protein